MIRISYSFIINFATIVLISFCGFLFANPPNCVICLQKLEDDFSVDVWGNTFHTEHENEGTFCHSCSRIISQGVTQGGYVYHDGRQLCSLCIITAVNNDSSIQVSYESVLLQFEAVGIPNLANNIPINLLNIHQLNQEGGSLSHAKMKGVTQVKSINTIDPYEKKFKISILSGLPRIEFEAVLAHELLHIWIYQNKIKLPLEREEGFCNLGRYLIYKNDQTQFSTIHLQAMEEDIDPIYGIEYRKMKVHLTQKGWSNLISNLMN